MPQTYIVNGQVYLDHSFQPMTVGIEGKAIRLLPPGAPLPKGAASTVSAPSGRGAPEGSSRMDSPSMPTVMGRKLWSR